MSVALDFANTVACPGCRVDDGLATTQDIERWLRAHRRELGPWDGPIPVAALRRLRTTVRQLFACAVEEAAPDATCLVAINRLGRLAATYPRLDWREGRRRKVIVAGKENSRDYLLASLAASVIATVAEEGRVRLRKCQSPRCTHYLLARTSRQIWCSPSGCGNRARVARHYRRARRRVVPVSG